MVAFGLTLTLTLILHNVNSNRIPISTPNSTPNPNSYHGVSASNLVHLVQPHDFSFADLTELYSNAKPDYA